MVCFKEVVDNPFVDYVEKPKTYAKISKNIVDNPEIFNLIQIIISAFLFLSQYPQDIHKTKMWIS